MKNIAKNAVCLSFVYLSVRYGVNFFFDNEILAKIFCSVIFLKKYALVSRSLPRRQLFVVVFFFLSKMVKFVKKPKTFRLGTYGS